MFKLEINISEIRKGQIAFMAARKFKLVLAMKFNIECIKETLDLYYDHEIGGNASVKFSSFDSNLSGQTQWE